MAKKKSIPTLEDRRLVDEIAKLHKRLYLAYCTATSIQFGLKHGLEYADQEVGHCMQHHVVDELYEIGEQLDLILVERGCKSRFTSITSAAD